MVALLDSLVPLKISISTGTEQMVQHPSVPSKSLLAQERSRQDLCLSQQENMTYEQLSALGWSLWILSNMVPKLCSLWFSLPYWEFFLLFGILGIHSSSPFFLGLAAVAKSLQSCPTLCDPRDGSPSGSPVPGILQARILEWVGICFSNAWKWKVKVKSLSRVQLLATPWTAAYQAPPSMGFSRQEYWSGVPLPSPW